MANKCRYLLKGWQMYPGTNVIFDSDDAIWYQTISSSKKINIFLKEKNYTAEYHSINGFNLGEIYNLINNTIFSAACDLSSETYPSKISVIGFDFDADTNNITVLIRNI